MLCYVMKLLWQHGDPVKYSMVNPLLFVLAYQRVINPLAVVQSRFYFLLFLQVPTPVVENSELVVGMFLFLIALPFLL